MVVRGGDLGKSMSAYLVERIRRNPLIDVRLQAEVTPRARGRRPPRLRDHLRWRAARAERLPARALFLCIGGVPRTGWAEESGIRINAKGFVLTGPDLLEEGAPPRLLAARPRPAGPGR